MFHGSSWRPLADQRPGRSASRAQRLTRFSVCPAGDQPLAGVRLHADRDARAGRRRLHQRFLRRIWRVTPSEAAPTACGTIVILVANTNRTEAAHERSESLAWSDAGCVMMTLHLVAEYRGLAFCPVGVLGTALVRALGEPTGWVAAGTCVVGTRTDGRPIAARAALRVAPARQERTVRGVHHSQG